MDAEYLLSLPQDELENIVRKKLEYLIKEGMVLTELLQEKGYNIARRTVAKYRELLNIPVARLRKEL